MLIKHAIIGCGRIAPNHIFGCQSNNAEVSVCCDIDEQKAKDFAAKYNIQKYTTDYREILNDDGIKSVSICTDHGSHARLTIESLRAGKNVIVEKPLALSIEDGRQMIEESEKAEKALCVISQHRYNKMISRIRDFVKQGTLGQITLINATLNCSKNVDYYAKSAWRGTLDKEGGSTLINQAIHTLDLVVWMHGQPNTVYSLSSNLKFKEIIETEDTLAAIMKFDDDSLGVLSSTNASVDEWDSKIEIIGTLGTITFSTGFPSRILKFDYIDDALGESLRNDLQQYAESPDDVPSTMSYYGTTHRDQMNDFFNVIDGKKDKLEMAPDEALKTLEVALRLYNRG